MSSSGMVSASSRLMARSARPPPRLVEARRHPIPLSGATLQVADDGPYAAPCIESQGAGRKLSYTLPYDAAGKHEFSAWAISVRTLPQKPGEAGEEGGSSPIPHPKTRGPDLPDLARPTHES